MKNFMIRGLRYILRKLEGGESAPLVKTLPFKYDGMTLVGPSYGFIEYYVHHFFKEERFAFKPNNSAPVIYDLGTNIGLSVLYFWRKYPLSRIVTLDPDTELLNKYCYPNFAANGVMVGDRLEVIEKAAWVADTTLTLYTDDKDGGAVERKMTDAVVREVKVPAINFGKLLEREERIDLLKMNIEGAEREVIEACKDHLHKVGYLFVDYHGLVGENSRLSDFLKILEKNNFKYTIGGRYGSLKTLDEELSNNIECGISIFAKRRDYV